MTPGERAFLFVLAGAAVGAGTVLILKGLAPPGPPPPPPKPEAPGGGFFYNPPITMQA